MCKSTVPLSDFTPVPPNNPSFNSKSCSNAGKLSPLLMPHSDFCAIGFIELSAHSPSVLPFRPVFSDRLLDPDWQENFLIFAEMHGESHGLLFDLSKPSRDMISFSIFEANPIDTIDNWSKVSRTFHEWLDHLITAQGDKYWEWK